MSKPCHRLAYQLAVTNKMMNIIEAMAFIQRRHDPDRLIEFFSFASGRKAPVKQTNLTTGQDMPAEEPSWLNENRLLADRRHRQNRDAKGVTQELLGAFVTEKRGLDPAHRIRPGTAMERLQLPASCRVSADGNHTGA